MGLERSSHVGSMYMRSVPTLTVYDVAASVLSITDPEENQTQYAY